MTYILTMHTVAETEIFQRYAASIWSDAELAEFIDWIAANPLVGDVIPGSVLVVAARCAGAVLGWASVAVLA